MIEPEQRIQPDRAQRRRELLREQRVRKRQQRVHRIPRRSAIAPLQIELALPWLVRLRFETHAEPSAHTAEDAAEKK
ncbi:hypothetical protein WME75_01715 [Sorangium sp. So ce1014]